MGSAIVTAVSTAANATVESAAEIATAATAAATAIAIATAIATVTGDDALARAIAAASVSAIARVVASGVSQQTAIGGTGTAIGAIGVIGAIHARDRGSGIGAVARDLVTVTPAMRAIGSRSVRMHAIVGAQTARSPARWLLSHRPRRQRSRPQRRAARSPR